MAGRYHVEQSKDSNSLRSLNERRDGREPVMRSLRRKSASHEVSQPDSQHTQHTAACEPSGKHYIRESAFCIALPATHIAVWTPEVTLVRYCSRCSDFSSLPKREKMLHNPASCMLTWYKHSLAGDSSASYYCQPNYCCRHVARSILDCCNMLPRPYL